MAGGRSDGTHSDLVPETSNLRSSARIAQSVEHILGKDEVTGSIPVVSSSPRPRHRSADGGGVVVVGYRHPVFGAFTLLTGISGAVRGAEAAGNLRFHGDLRPPGRWCG